MKKSQDLKSSHKLFILLLGEPGSGKTTLAAQFPRPAFADGEHKLTNIFNTVPNASFIYEDLDTDDNDRPIEGRFKWQRTLTVCDRLLRMPDVDTLVIDSLSRLSGYLCEYLIHNSTDEGKKVAGEKVMTLPLWYPFQTLMDRFLTRLPSYGKHVIVTAHVRSDQDEVRGTMEWSPAIGGSLRRTISKFFTDTWYCDVKPCAPSKEFPKGVRYIVRTMPNTRLSLAQSLDLPAEFTFNWPLVQAALDKVS